MANLSDWATVITAGMAALAFVGGMAKAYGRLMAEMATIRADLASIEKHLAAIDKMLESSPYAPDKNWRMPQ